ncbi:MAG: hypothetical protein NTV87_16990 [Ignavibacteriae bacterium]|nr:hypothetical protein [Ignavibacteriota bacterium]
MAGYKEYSSALEGWMNYHRMQALEVEPNWLFDKVYSKSYTAASKFGRENVYAFIKHYEKPPDVAVFAQFSSECYKYSMKIFKGGLVGLGAHLTAYPMMAVNVINNELAEFIRTYCSKHFASAEFPGVLDLSTNDLYFYPATPAWGAFYYSGYRQTFYELFS